MSKILITGNGFDLFHHLPTKYGHFMAIMETIEKYDFKKEITFEDLFGIYFKDGFFNDYKMILEKYTTNEIFFERTRIRELAEKLKTNNWYNYFKSALEIESWIDFENEINIALSEVLEILNPDAISSKEVFWDCQRHSLLSYFNLFDREKPSDLRINIEYSKSKKYMNGLNKYQVINEKKIFENLSLSLNEFKVIFNRYFVDIVNPFYPKIKYVPKINFNNINTIYSFNYTSTLKFFYSIEDSKVIHLHGKSNILDTNQNLILGVNEISDKLKLNKLYDFTKYYQKIEEKSDQTFISIPGKSKNLNETLFYIIGHSLDISDKEYILDLFKFLENDEKRRSKICIFYYDKKDKDNKLKNLFSVVENEEKVVNIYKEGRLYFVELTEENLKREFEKSLYVYTPYV